MRILLVGGLDRNEAQLSTLAAAHGHDLELHTGDVGGRGAEMLTRKIERADLVVIATEVNSHGGVLLAKKVVRKYAKPSLLLRKVGHSRLQALFNALEARSYGVDRVA